MKPKRKPMSVSRSPRQLAERIAGELFARMYQTSVHKESGTTTSFYSIPGPVVMADLIERHLKKVRK